MERGGHRAIGVTAPLLLQVLRSYGMLNACETREVGTPPHKAVPLRKVTKVRGQESSYHLAS